MTMREFNDDLTLMFGIVFPNSKKNYDEYSPTDPAIVRSELALVKVEECAGVDLLFYEGEWWLPVSFIEQVAHREFERVVRTYFFAATNSDVLWKQIRGDLDYDGKLDCSLLKDNYVAIPYLRRAK